MKGFIHAHSKYSYDSLNDMDLILDKAIENELDFIILTDHDTINGSLHLNRRAQERNLNLIIPKAAEYKTEYGDIIAAFIDHEIHETNFENFIYEVTRQNGILMLPHPYQSHPIEMLEYIASKMDIIEVFNARCTQEQDIKAELLAKNTNKPVFYGSDAHLKNELCNVIISIETSEKNEASLKEALLNNKISLISKDKIYLRGIRFSQFIKAFKRKSISILYRNATALIIDLIRYGWNKKIS